MKCDICGINMYAMTPHYMDNENSKLYCENCYKNKLAGKGKALTVITPSLKDYEKILRQIKRVIKLKKEEERIKKSLEKYRVRLIEYIQNNENEESGWYAMESEINKDLIIHANPLFKRSEKPYHSVTLTICNKKTNEYFYIYPRKD